MAKANKAKKEEKTATTSNEKLIQKTTKMCGSVKVKRNLSKKAKKVETNIKKVSFKRIFILTKPFYY
jgi:hypothetical protein